MADLTGLLQGVDFRRMGVVAGDPPQSKMAPRMTAPYLVGSPDLRGAACFCACFWQLFRVSLRSGPYDATAGFLTV